ncbi:MAG: hypothetical protein M3335_00095 [Actinomycetota bacterium]|nr:hypothetical protein [Actinomycetota bacterium]
MESVRRWAGYFLPEGMTMADVRRRDEELFASEGLELLKGFPLEDRHEEAFQEEE